MKIRFPFRVWLLALLCLICARAAGAATPSLQTTFDPNGLATLRYGALTLTDTGARGDDAFSLYDVDGAPIEKVWDARSQTLTFRYIWGEVACQYAQRGDQLDLDIAIVNRSDREVGGFNMFPLGLTFSGFPKGYDATTPHVRFNADGPSVQSADFGSGIVSVINRDVTKPLAVGLISSNDTAQSFRYQVYVGSARLWYQPDNWPTYPRPVPAGGRDFYQISLRFSPPGSDTSHVADDINAAYAKAHPMELRWDDRRPLASLFLSSASDNHPPNNPRGWFYNDPSIDVNSADGRARLRERVMKFADDSIAEMKSVGAQGMITWDIEGQEYPHATSYIGDPRLTAQLAPEMDAIADEYFARFRGAGLRVGVCVRPQQLVVGSNGADQIEVADVAAQLSAKVQYAKSRWGATLFYVDSNGGPYDPTDAAIFAQVARAHPDVLLIPEHQNAAYYAYTAPYNHSNEASAFTPDEVRALYPRAFSVVKLMGDDFDSMRAAIIEAARHGDILMFNGWYDSPDGAYVRDVYQQIGQSLRVTTLADTVADDGQTSLREAMAAANAIGGGRITFAPDVRGTIRLNGTALPLLRGDCQIVGPGARVLAVSGEGKSGLFQIARGATVELSGLKIKNGNAGGETEFNGGAIYNFGDLTARDCFITGNRGNAGGAVFNVGSEVSFERCTFSANVARHVGGAIFSANGALALRQCTFVSNASLTASGGGAAICANGVRLDVLSCTLSGNRSGGEGGAIWFQNGLLSLHNSILAGNSARVGAPDVQVIGGDLASRGANIIGAATARWSWVWRANDITGAPAGLDKLRDNGGQTPTCALLPGSAAWDAGDSAVPEQTDQRGAPRFQGARVDIGALEMPGASAPGAVSAGGSGGSS